MVEGHKNDFWFHFNQSNLIYGVSFLLIIAGFILLKSKIKNKPLFTGFIVSFGIVFLFFTLAKTKMIAFTYCISSLGFLSLGIIIYYLFKIIIVDSNVLKAKVYSTIFKTIILTIIGIYLFNYEQIQKNHTLWLQHPDSMYVKKENSIELIKNLDSFIEVPEKTVVFNFKNWDHIQAMFFNNIAAAYQGFPSIENVNEIKAKGFQIALFPTNNMPDFLNEDSEIVFLNQDY